MKIQPAQTNPLTPLRLHPYLEKITNPTTHAWQNPAVRKMLEDYLCKEIFKSEPAFGMVFTSEMNRLCGLNLPENDIYKNLHSFFKINNGLDIVFHKQYRGNRLQERANQIKELLADYSPKSLLDVGCGSGEITNQLMNDLNIPSSNVRGIETSHIESKYSFPIIVYNGVKFPDFKQPFDLVTVFSVLHHLEDPVQFIRGVHDTMNKGNRLVIRDCHSPTEEQKLFNLIADYLWYKVFTPCDEVPIPGNYLSSDEWKSIFESEGFKAKKITYPEPDNPYEPFMMLLERE